MIRSLPLALLAALCLGAPAAYAQDPLALARAEYAGLTGEWAEPGRGCGDPSGTWSFGMEAVRAGDSLYDLRGIGAGPETARLDLISRRTGRRLPLAVTHIGQQLDVRGQGVAVTLVPCNALASTGVDRPETIVTRPLGGLPSEDDLRARLGALEPTEPATPTTPPQPGTAPEAPDAAGIAPDAAYDARLTGSWRGADGTCGWRLGPSRIFAEGTAYEVVNFSGTAERIGIQTLREDGTPTTFTLTPGTGGAAGVTRSAPGEEQVGATLTRC